MHVRLRLDGSKPQRWHVALLRRIGEVPGLTAVSVDDAPASGAWPHTADLLFRLEALVHGLARLGTEPVPGSELQPWRRPDARPDLVLDLCGDVPSGPATWHIAYDGRVGPDSLLASLLADAVPRLTLVENGAIRAAGRLGADRPGIVLASFEDALARTITLITAALHDRIAGRVGAGGTGDAPVDHRRVLTVPRLGVRAGRMLAGALIHRLYRLCYSAPHWRCGWRRLTGPDLIDLGRHPEAGWTVLPDDGRRFYADPFPISVGGSTHLFVEAFPHATGKAIISAVRFGPDGPEGAPVPVLEEAHHLS